MSRSSFQTTPVAQEQSVVGGNRNRYRFSVLTEGLIRFEWASDSNFEDRASVFAIHRDLPVTQFRVKESAASLDIITARVHLTYDKQPFSPSGLHAVVKGKFGPFSRPWRYGEASRRNLGGTARTLDEADGPVLLGPGVIGRDGHATVDDSESMLFDGLGFVSPRRGGDRIDGYLFAYGHDYRAAIRALFDISGHQPLLPRWALGNWWSRYHAYSAEEYLDLLDRFEHENIPLSVAILDMGWHLVDDQCVRDANVTGWTGYTWNRQLFPDPEDFLSQLHKRQLKTALNDHPADGIQSYEDCYKTMSKALDIDTSFQDPIAFNIADKKFCDAYFDVLHRTFEDQGVDFWWIDWQQGEYSQIKGIDPLWVLNHFHFLDSSRDQKRPLTFSRYAGPGSHRYPIGFSGDAHITWATLHFQPEFTATAANIGYGWWSHDIGGHYHGSRDDELAIRWLQLGAFSPILRMHSSARWSCSKEPWNWGQVAPSIMTYFLRLRHRLIPYLYSMNVRSARHGQPLVQPLYWDYPERAEAYRYRNQYLFGSELLVMPITAPGDPKLRVGRVLGWLPPGRYVDIFTGAVYDGDREMWFSRSLSTYPVFAREGSILVLDANEEPGKGAEHPTAFEVILAVGTDGSFELHEDGGKGSDLDKIESTVTPITYVQRTGTLQIGPAKGRGPRPTSRGWNVRLISMQQQNLKAISIFVGGSQGQVVAEMTTGGVLLRFGHVPTEAQITIQIGKEPQLGLTDSMFYITPFLEAAQIDLDLKDRIQQIFRLQSPRMLQVSTLHALEMEQSLLLALLEYLLADSRAV